MVGRQCRRQVVGGQAAFSVPPLLPPLVPDTPAQPQTPTPYPICTFPPRCFGLFCTGTMVYLHCYQGIGYNTSPHATAATEPAPLLQGWARLRLCSISQAGARTKPASMGAKMRWGSGQGPEAEGEGCRGGTRVGCRQHSHSSYLPLLLTALYSFPSSPLINWGRGRKLALEL